MPYFGKTAQLIRKKITVSRLAARNRNKVRRFREKKKAEKAEEAKKVQTIFGSKLRKFEGIVKGSRKKTSWSGIRFVFFSVKIF